MKEMNDLGLLDTISTADLVFVKPPKLSVLVLLWSSSGRVSLRLILSSRGISTMNVLPSWPQCHLVVAAKQALTSFLIPSPLWPCFLVLSPFLRNPFSSLRAGLPSSHLSSSPRLMHAGSAL